MANGSSCAYYVKPGKAHPNYPGGKYNVCITPNQHRELFGAGAPAAPTPIGCGVFACAYPSADPGKIVKVTRDHSDVAALKAAQGLPGVPKLFGAFQLASHAFWARPERYVPRDPYDYSYRTPKEKRALRPTVFGLVVERLRPLDKQQRLRWRRRINCIAWQMSRDHEPRAVVKGCCPTKPKAERRACLRGGIQLARTVEKLREHGIKVGDLHAGNVGLDARGRWKILDLGQAEGAGYPDVPDLAGARGRSKRGARKRRR
jgi:hypothetical protein